MNVELEDEVRNWLGQLISVGDTVYRGAREGDGSEFRVGVVTGFSRGKTLRVRVQWHHRYRWSSPGTLDIESTVELNSVVVISDEVLQNLNNSVTI